MRKLKRNLTKNLLSEIAVSHFCKQKIKANYWINIVDSTPSQLLWYIICINQPIIAIMYCMLRSSFQDLESFPPLKKLVNQFDNLWYRVWNPVDKTFDIEVKFFNIWWGWFDLELGLLLSKVRRLLQIFATFRLFLQNWESE